MDPVNLIGAVVAVAMAGLCAVRAAFHYTTPRRALGTTYMTAAMLLSLAAGYLIRG